MKTEGMNRYRGTKSTKFRLTLLTLLLGTAALFWGKISGDVWAMSVVGLVAIYVGGDVGARFSAGAGK